MAFAQFPSLPPSYHWQESLIAFVAIMAASILLPKLLGLLIPAVGAEQRVNRQTYAEKMAKPNYAANQAWNRKWGIIFQVVIFAAILPFCLTADAQPWWRIGRDVVVILLFYDFFYYLVHRFLFHDAGFLGGPLVWVHAVHHRQHNPCRGDSSYIHPLEVAMGLGLYAGSIFVLSLLLGAFSVATIVVTWIAFSEINQHNHDRWSLDRFPFRYANTMSVMHHNHHARFTGGNFATISLLYDWMFGTLDYGQGEGFGRMAKRPAGKAPQAEAQPSEAQPSEA